MKVDNYTLTKIIGEGSFGEVFFSYKQDSVLNYATKRMDKSLVESKYYLKYFLNEITILKSIYHKNIVKMVDIKKTLKHYYIMTEYYNGGTLKHNYDKYKLKYGHPFPEKIVQHIMRQLVDAISYLHEKKIVHRDLKLENILLNYSSPEAKENIDILNSELKLIDFGSATYVKNADLLQTVIGSPLTMDPRILKKYNAESPNNLPYDEKIDVWSLGIIGYYMFTGDVPFKATNVYGLTNEIENGYIQLPTNLSKEAVSFLLNMLQYNPSKRITATDLKQHPFLQGYIGNFSLLDLKKYSKLVKNGNLTINIKHADLYDSIINLNNQESLKQNSFNSNSGLETLGIIGGFIDVTSSAPFIGVKKDTSPIQVSNFSKSVCEPIINNLINNSALFNDQSFQNSLLIIKNNNDKSNNLASSSPISSIKNYQNSENMQPLTKISMNERLIIYKSALGIESLNTKNSSKQIKQNSQINQINNDNSDNKTNQNIVSSKNDIHNPSIYQNNIIPGNISPNIQQKFSNSHSQIVQSGNNFSINQNDKNNFDASFMSQNMQSNNPNMYHSYQFYKK